MPLLKAKLKEGVQQEFSFVGNKSDWIDLRSGETVEMKQGEYRLIDLGFAMELPQGYEALIIPRSSTFKNYGILFVNSIGLIDNSYCGDNDYWKFPALAMRDTVIQKGDRICQFRIQKSMENIFIEIVDSLGNPDRQGIGSTGV